MKKLGFGFMRLPLTDQADQSSIDFKTLEDMVDIFLERGFTYFDTAYMYHEFKSEIALRETLVKRHPREAFTVASKLPTMFLKESGDQERIFNEQLKKCGVDYFDYYLLHNLNVSHYEVVQRFDSFSFIQEKKQQGKIKQIGFSHHDDAALLDRILTEHPETDFVQLQLNYLDWENEGIQSRKCYEVACAHGVSVVVMEPVKGGTLAQVPSEAASLFHAVDPQVSVASWAVRFAASLDGVTTVLSGMSEMSQLLDNTSYMQEFRPFSPEEHEVVEQATQVINEGVAIPCTVCRYCTDECPLDIAIPDYFALYNAEKQTDGKGFSVQGVYYGNIIQEHGKASACIDCKRCEELCPQHIEITQWLPKVADAFENQE